MTVTVFFLNGYWYTSMSTQRFRNWQIAAKYAYEHGAKTVTVNF